MLSAIFFGIQAQSTRTALRRRKASYITFEPHLVLHLGGVNQKNKIYRYYLNLLGFIPFQTSIKTLLSLSYLSHLWLIAISGCDVFHGKCLTPSSAHHLRDFLLFLVLLAAGFLPHFGFSFLAGFESSAPTRWVRFISKSAALIAFVNSLRGRKWASNTDTQTCSAEQSV